MSVKVMIVKGSPRKDGNTATVAGWIGQGLEEAGAEVTYVDAARLNYKTYGCTSCLGCQQSDEFRCIIKDEASDVLAQMPDQNIIIFATPVYFMGFSAQIKLLIDRMFSLFKMDETGVRHVLQKPEFVLVATAGGDEGSGLNLTRSTMKAIAGFIGKSIKEFMVPFAPVSGDDVTSSVEWKEKAHEFGYKLIADA